MILHYFLQYSADSRLHFYYTVSCVTVWVCCSENDTQLGIPITKQPQHRVSHRERQAQRTRTTAPDQRVRQRQEVFHQNGARLFLFNMHVKRVLTPVFINMNPYLNILQVQNVIHRQKPREEADSRGHSVPHSLLLDLNNETHKNIVSRYSYNYVRLCRN